MHKKITFLLMFLLGVFIFLTGCSDGIGVSNTHGVGELLVTNLKIEGEIYKEDIDKVIVNGEFCGWTTMYDLRRQSDGIWKLDFSELPAEHQPQPGQQYGFSYWDSAAGVTPDSHPWGVWMDHSNLIIEEGQTEFEFDAEKYARLGEYVNEGSVVVGEKTGQVGTKITLLSGQYDLTVNAEINGTNYTGTRKDIIISPNETTIVEGIVLSPPVILWKFTFDPARYGLSADDIVTVHLAGEMNSWNTDYDTCGYQLNKKENGQWVNTFDSVNRGQLFNWLVYKVGDDQPTWLPSGMGNNLVVDEMTEGVEIISDNS